MIQVYEGNGRTNRLDRVQGILLAYVNKLLFQRIDEDIDAELKAIFGSDSRYEQFPPRFVIKHGNRWVIASVQDGEVRVSG